MPDPVLALVTARGGSKRLPRKNVLDCGGKPLIAWTIEAALQSGVCSRVVVSTEDPEIAAVSREYGAEVPFVRPAELASDTATSISVEQHALRWLAESQGWRPTWSFLLQPTSPLRTAADIREALRVARVEHAVYVVGVTDGPRVWPAWRDRWPRPAPESPVKIPTIINGAIYLRRYRSGDEWSADVHWGYYMPPERSIDVDTAWELAMADALLRRWHA